ncbi:ATP-binding protein [Mucisphaera calidilacus]|uniref:histidine kinase n=1 Tax=Mucisphaera calidilacus TaxID=2527982 RepID=A0A518BU01_9BACT|nr:ATP-binding protein [Mucisphaera calidilacus]QDU70435.1 Autoinducer 2 sensor kinase/phosphatase LuxQ [Mucisphaera calidilacus]
MNQHDDSQEVRELREHIQRLERMNLAMMDRIERTVDNAGSAYAMFESNIVMQQTIRERTMELAQANEALRREITERTIAEEQMRIARDQAEAASRAKSEFLANMSHEIRTPMTAILGYAELLNNEIDIEHDADQVGRIAHTIHNNANHLLSVINDILDMSKIEAGRMSVEMIDTNPVRLLSDVVAIMKPRADDKQIQLTSSFISSLPAIIQTDPTRLRQVLINIIGNAIKFTAHGSVDIVASCEAATQTLSFSIRDTGIGMTAGQLQQLNSFQAFTQADSSMSRRFGGTGLGLSISNSLARLLGGRIDIASTKDKGSTFTLTVHTGDLSHAQMIAPDDILTELERENRRRSCENTPTTCDVSLMNRRVLLAEDGPDNQRLIAHHLRKAGADVTLCDNGLLAVQTIENTPADQHPHVILMDMQMPVLDGYQATRRLRASHYAGPILALTAHVMDTDRQKCLDAGCDDYLSKPINAKHLIARCSQWARQNDHRNAA